MPLTLLKLLLISGLLSVLAAPAQAIVVRHDTGYTRYIASEAEYPAVFPLEQQAQRKVCVATLIAPQWALTAAHCVTETSLQATLDRGQTYAVQIARSTHQVEAVMTHPRWTGTATQVLDQQQIDLALLRLSAPVEGVEPVALYRGQSEMDKIMTFLGWGYTGIGTTGISVDDGRLRFARNTVMQADARLRFEFSNPAVLGSAAVEFEGIPGLGDSGGPALYDDGAQTLLAGIAIGELSDTSTKRRAGRYGAVVVYERISQHLDWIDSALMQTGDAGQMAGSLDISDRE